MKSKWFLRDRSRVFLRKLQEPDAVTCRMQQIAWEVSGLLILIAEWKEEEYFKSLIENNLRN